MQDEVRRDPNSTDVARDRCHPASGTDPMSCRLVLEVVPSLLKSLGTSMPWTVLAWLETPHVALNECTPHMAIERGQVERVL